MLTQPNCVDLLLKDITSVLKRTAGSGTAMVHNNTPDGSYVCQLRFIWSIINGASVGSSLYRPLRKGWYLPLYKVTDTGF